MNALAVKPLLYLIGLLLVALVALGTRGCVQSANARTDAAKLETADELVGRVRTERDAWKRQAETNAANANTCATSLATMSREYERQQRDHATLDAQRQAAITAAQAAEQDASRTLARFTAQFQAESRKPDCGAALAAVGRACPALENY